MTTDLEVLGVLGVVLYIISFVAIYCSFILLRVIIYIHVNVLFYQLNNL